MEEVLNMMNDIPGMTLGRFPCQSEAGNDEQVSAPQFDSFIAGGRYPSRRMVDRVMRANRCR